MDFIRVKVKDGSQVITDGWDGYTPLSITKEYHHVKMLSLVVVCPHMNNFHAFTWLILW